MRITGLTILACSSFLFLAGCNGQPQIGPDRDTFKAVDALYTAVSLRDPKLVDRCADDLSQLHFSGKLPDDAYRSLDGLISEAKSGQWEPSQERLAQFMEAQRR